jgi:hypothetical protein
MARSVWDNGGKDVAITRRRLKRALLGLADLVERYPEVVPLLERLEKDWDARENAKNAADRVRAKLALTDD